MGLVADVVRQGQARGEVRADLDPVVAASGLLGALELAVSAMVMGLVPASSEDDIDRAKRHMIDLDAGRAPPLLTAAPRGLPRRGELVDARRPRR